MNGLVLRVWYHENKIPTIYLWLDISELEIEVILDVYTSLLDASMYSLYGYKKLNENNLIEEIRAIKNEEKEDLKVKIGCIKWLQNKIVNH